MSNHQKRLSAPKSWPVERKAEKFTVKADAGPHGEEGVPLLVLLRDVLGYADSRKEARYALNQDNVIINGKAVSDEERPVGMFDILAFDEREEYYRVFPGEGGRLALTPIDAEAAQSKLGKIVNKQHVPGGNVQLTLHDGQTLLVEEDSEYEGGDSLVVANEDSGASDDVPNASGDEPRAGEVVAHFEYEEGALVTAVDGAHAGEIGVIDEIQMTASSAENNVIVSQDDVPGVSGSGFETVEEYIVVIDENFVEGGDEESDTDEEEPEAEEPEESDSAESEDESETDVAEGDGGDDE
ncbi:MAG: 30S ribosomal protein S4e [Haloarculaceae archaeon]